MANLKIYSIHMLQPLYLEWEIILIMSLTGHEHVCQSAIL